MATLPLIIFVDASAPGVACSYPQDKYWYHLEWRLKNYNQHNRLFAASSKRLYYDELKAGATTVHRFQTNLGEEN